MTGELDVKLPTPAEHPPCWPHPCEVHTMIPWAFSPLCAGFNAAPKRPPVKVPERHKR